MDIITKNEKYYQVADIVMLSTEKESSIFLSDDKISMSSMPNYVSSPNAVHLYALSSEYFDIGDWVFDVDENKIFQFKNPKGLYFAGELKKIIATTDTSLVKLIPDAIIGKAPTHFPNFSDEFISNFIVTYNNNYGKLINRVLVEYEYKRCVIDANDFDVVFKLINNNIVIETIEDEKLYTAEDMKKCYIEAVKHYIKFEIDPTESLASDYLVYLQSKKNNN